MQSSVEQCRLVVVSLLQSVNVECEEKKHLAVIPKFLYVVVHSVSGEFKRILHFYRAYVEMLCIQFLSRNKQFKDLHFENRRQAPLKLSLVCFTNRVFSFSLFQRSVVTLYQQEKDIFKDIKRRFSCSSLTIQTS